MTDARAAPENAAHAIETLPSITTNGVSSEERIQEAAALWFARLRGDEVSDAERTAFAAWLDADARHRHEYVTLERLWDASAQLRSPALKRRRAMRAAASLAGVALVCGWLGWAWLDGRMATDAGERQHLRLYAPASCPDRCRASSCLHAVC